MPTPVIPDWIRNLEHPGYKNIFSYNLGNMNLWGTETFLGDWNGRFLLVAKDYYPSSSIDEAQIVARRIPIVTSRNQSRTASSVTCYGISAG